MQRTAHLTASKRAIGFVGALPRAIGFERDHGVELRVQALDACEKMLEKFAAADLASANRRGEVEGGSMGDVVHGRRIPRRLTLRERVHSVPAVISSIGVFCGSSSQVAALYREAAAALGTAIARRGLRLVYGGGRIGLMGLLADAALAAGGRVVGVIPEFLRGLEVAHTGLTELRVVPTMHDRKRAMFELADAFVVLPGGLGTLDETIEIVTWKQLGLHDKPVVMIDVGSFSRGLRALMNGIVAEGFAHPEHAGLWTTVGSIEAALEAVGNAPAPRVAADAKWT